MTATAITFALIAAVSAGFGIGTLWGARCKSRHPQEDETYLDTADDARLPDVVTHDFTRRTA
jgi:hypothetical protein